MADYTYDSELVADPFSFQRAANASITVYDSNDENETTPLVLKDLTGLPLPNPLASNADAFVPAFVATSAQVKMVGGGLRVVRASFQGVKDAAVAAASSAEAAAADAAEAVSLAQAPTDAQVDAGIARADIPSAISVLVPGLIGAQVPPLVADAIASDGTVAAAAAAAVTDAVAAADLIEGTDNRIPANVLHDEYLNVTTDTSGRISEGTRVNGRKHLPQADIDEAAVGTLTATHLEAQSFTNAGQTVTQVSASEYSKITTDPEGRIAEDALDAGGRVPEWVLGAWAGRMAPTLRSVLGVAPELKLASFGDSMTYGLNGGGTTFPAVAAADLGWSHYNGGVSSQTSTEVALRQGGLEVLVTVTGNSIPTSGPIAVTAITPTGTWRAGFAWSFPGTLAGIPGILAKSATEVWTFTRTTAGSPTTCLPGTRFLSETAAPYNNWVNTLWVGRNNPTLATIQRDVTAMVASLVPIKPRYLVLGVCNTSNEASGTSGYNNVVAINAALATTYGGNFFDVRRWLIDNGLTAAGISPTASDTTAIAEDRIPPSLMSDTIHLTAAGYAAVGHRVAAIIIEKSWNL